MCNNKQQKEISSPFYNLYLVCLCTWEKYLDTTSNTMIKMMVKKGRRHYEHIIEPFSSMKWRLGYTNLWEIYTPQKLGIFFPKNCKLFGNGFGAWEGIIFQSIDPNTLVY